MNTQRRVSMKNKHYALIMGGTVLLIAVAFALQCVFCEQTAKFGFSCGAYFLSTFCLACFKNALKPTESFGPINKTKQYFEKNGGLAKYQSLCKILFAVTSGAGALAFIGGVGDVLFSCVKQMLTR